MQSLENRLLALERHSATQTVLSGLDNFYEFAAVVDKVGSADALLARLDSGTTTDDDRTALAGIPRAHESLRVLVNSRARLSHFYGE